MLDGFLIYIKKTWNKPSLFFFYFYFAASEALAIYDNG
ncbi:hypothetical protein STRUR_1108 [Streptococcus urinalis 2285-97]|uniref:Uncharacterized protein n=1 Tax=Streptococcus urinalis 2285-97 TaxID=764291 RepID=G5KFU9_9STRE|nr:hypothetical protein STRUR_1108 [Streptococcus urinalis 2285-97]